MSATSAIITVLFDVLSGSVLQYGYVPDYPAKLETQQEMRISQEQFDWMIYNCPCVVDGTNIVAATLVTPPVDFPHGIALPALTNASKFYSIHPIEGSTDVIAVEAHASPYDPDAHKARIEAEVSRRQAIKDELDLTQQQIDAIRIYFAADVDTLFPTLTAAQRQFLKVQRAAVRYLLKQEVKEVSAP